MVNPIGTSGPLGNVPLTSVKHTIKLIPSTTTISVASNSTRRTVTNKQTTTKSQNRLVAILRVSYSGLVVG